MRTVVIPQDIIDSVIAAVGYNKRFLKRSSLVSSSFLLPSRKLLFSRITLKSDETCQNIHQFLLRNPVIQYFVRKIILFPDFDENPNYEWLYGTSLLAVLRLPFVLEHFSILNVDPYNRDLRYWNWNIFRSELQDSLLNIIQSSNLKRLYLGGVTNLPITFLSHIVHLKTLKLELLSPDDFDNEDLSSLTSKGVAQMASHAVIDQCVWCLSRHYVCSKRFPSSAYILLIQDIASFTKPIFLAPFMCSLRFFEINVVMDHFDIFKLSLLMGSICISLTSPATLEHLKLKIRFLDYSNSNAEGWSRLDSITSHPAGSRLQRVDIIITYPYCSNGYRHYVKESVEDVLDGLPLLCIKDILFVDADSGDYRVRHVPGMSRTTDR